MSDSPLWLAEDVLRALQGRCLQEQSWAACGVSVDSRMTRRGDLFIALSRGGLYDGHDDIAAAFEAGAVAALVSHQPLQAPPGATLIFVDNTFEALGRLAQMARARAQGKIVALAGSIGKSSVKDMLRLALGAIGKTHVSPVLSGMPWDLLLAMANMPPDAEYGVFEINGKEKGSVASHSRLLQPHIAVVTAIEPVGLDRYDSLEALADSEAEVFQGVVDKGVAVFLRDGPFGKRLAAAAKKERVKTILSFSTEGTADASVRDVSLRADGSLVNAVISGYEVSYALGVPGRHHVRNSLAALLTVSVLSGRMEEGAAVLAHYAPSCSASRSVDLPDGGSFSLIDESGDASMPSVQASIDALSLMAAERKGRRILVLGEIPELGVTAPDLHIGLVPHIRAAGVSLVFCCGDTMRYLFDALPDSLRGAYADTSDELSVLLAHAVRPDDIVWVKGPQYLEMERVVEALTSLAFPSRYNAANG